VVRLGPYRGVLREAILETKGSAWRRQAHELGLDLARQVALVRGDRALVVVPVATSFFRRMGRGMDHTLALARGVGAGLGAPVVRGLVRRHAPKQTGRSLRERGRNVAGTMRPAGDALVRSAAGDGRVVLLIDDVMTSGATMREAVRAVREVIGDGEVWVGVIAVTEPHEGATK
jgi:predicted amidophosphoribosyltransferase